MSKKKEIVDQIKKLAFDLAREYKSNLKIEINVNPKYESAKTNITEFNQ